MNSEIKRRWVEALRSGKYEQTKSYLRFQNKFCCLGVLCDLDDSSKWHQTSRGIWDYDDKTYAPTNGVLKNADLPLNQTTPLANMNDEGKSFSQIADYIENHY